MDRDGARQEIKRNWRRLYPADHKGKGIICPLCGSGSGQHGTGITENPQKPGQLRCWSCDFAGDVIALYMQERGVDYNTALSDLANEIGIVIDGRPTLQEAFPEAAQNARKGGFKTADNKNYAADATRPQEATQQPTAAVIADYTEYYNKCSQNLNDPAAISYLQARGISYTTAAGYNLGYDAAWISPAAIKRLEAKGNEWRPTPTARIIIPVTKNHYVTRAISPDVAKEFAKMNETGGGNIGIFNAGAVYGNQEAVFVTEGVFDALSIIECGAAAVALNSTSNADAFIKQLEARPTRATLVLCLDNDDAGKRATDVMRQGLTRLNISYVIADICGGHKDPNEALTGNRAAFEKAIREAQAQTAARPDNIIEYIDNLMYAEIERLKAAADRKTGFSELDEKSGGLYPGLYVIAATSSLGKTTFALQVADNLATAGHDVLFFSMEQSRLELVSKSFARMLAIKKGVFTSDDPTSLTLRKGYRADKMQEAIAIYKKRIADRMNIIEGNFNCNISFIGDYIRRYIRRNQCKPIVFIDYLQILQPADENRRATVRETVDTTVTELKRISRENDLTVFVISSVNRANYLTPIDFESLKESGGIEYTADCIWGLQLQCLNDPIFDDPQKKIKEKRQRIREAKAAMPRKIELLCLKNRYGIANFSCGFDYYPRYDLFRETDGFEFLSGTDKRNPFDADSQQLPDRI